MKAASERDLFGIFYVRKPDGIKWDSYYRTIDALRPLFNSEEIRAVISGFYLNICGNFDSVRISYFADKMNSGRAIAVFKERLAAVIETMRELHKTRWLITQADIRRKLSVEKVKMKPVEMKSVERAVKDLVVLGVVKSEYEEKDCRHCGRPLGKGPFYSLTGLVPVDIRTGIKTYDPETPTPKWKCPKCGHEASPDAFLPR